MKKIFILLLALLSGCSVLMRFAEYGGQSKQFVEALVKADYTECLKRIDLDAINKSGVPTDSLSRVLQQINEGIKRNFGNEIDVSIAKLNKTLSSNSVKNVTEVVVQLANGKEFTYAEFKFNDENEKIISFSISNQKYPVPSHAQFWLVGILAVAVAAFNVLTIAKIVKANVNRKAIKVLIVLVFNVPTFMYSLINGFSFELLSFQLLLGVGVGFMGYAGTAWSIGVPLGSFYVWWKMKNWRRDKELADNFNEEMV